MSTTQWQTALTVPVDEDRDHFQGPADAAVTLVEYGDYECPYCGAAYPIVKEVQARMGDRLRFVFRNFPITTSHPHAEQAAESAEAAAAQGRFWEMHDVLYENQRHLEDEDLHAYAEQLGLDVERLGKELARRPGVSRGLVQSFGLVLGKPGLRDALLRSRQPRLDDEVAQLVAVDVLEIRDAQQHGGIAVPVRRREEIAPGVGEQELLDIEVGDAKHEDVVEPFARVRVDGVGPRAPVEAKHLPVHEVRRPPVLGDLLRRLRQHERELVDVGHRRHASPSPGRAGSASTGRSNTPR